MFFTFLLLLVALVVGHKMWSASEDSLAYRRRCLAYEIDELEDSITSVRSIPYLTRREIREVVASIEEEIELLKYEMDNLR